jgi:hypothetical protein
MSTQSFTIGYFDSEEKVLKATRAVREAGHDIHDVYTPYAVHGLDAAQGLKPSKLTWVTFLAGLTGLTAALSLQIYTSAISWKLNVGGKPFLSLPAFVPVTFELTVLFGGLATVAAFLILTKHYPGNQRLTLPRVTDDRFAIALVQGAGAKAANLETVLRHHGAVETEKREVVP